MGKTEKGAVWLDEKLLSSYDYWQFWRNTDDRDVLKFLKMFTDIELNKIEEIKDKEINDLKVLLANEATAMLHGKKAAQKAEDTAKKTFGKGSFGDDLPTINLNKSNIDKGINIIELVLLSNLLSSKSEVRRSIKNNGIKINNNLVTDDKIDIKSKDFNNENILKLSFGKKKKVIFKIN